MTRSSFFYTPGVPEEGSLAILHLKRDDLLPVVLKTTANDGYAEGAVANTRFGSYPHTTIIGAPWGNQIRASKVDTGTRGRKAKPTAHSAGISQTVDATSPSTKRKLDEDEIEAVNTASKKQKVELSPALANTPVEAPTGFMHVLQPTPEMWTASLDHRTQVVYVPDYSYILSRLAVKPGDVMIEAGAGSGSFSHAAARAVYNDYPTAGGIRGRVYSFEYHEPRVQTLREELRDHGLEKIIQLTHRDVCGEGFTVPDSSSPNVVAVFLDLPAPWLALKHLTRSAPDSPLSKDAPVRVCTFSPCIEQVTLSVAALRSAGWADIKMVEVANRKIEVRRERVGMQEAGLRGVNAVPASVQESLSRLREVEEKLKHFKCTNLDAENVPKTQTKAERFETNKRAAEQRKLFKEGNLLHRTESEIKTHTSYLVFAILPREY